MKTSNQPLRLALLGIASLCIMQPTDLIAGCGSGGCGAKKSSRGGGGYNHGAWLKQQREKQARREARDLKIEILKEYMEPIDTNNDGSISRDEFIAYEGSEESFDAANKNGDRYLTKSEIAKMIDVEGQIAKR